MFAQQNSPPIQETAAPRRLWLAGPDGARPRLLFAEDSDPVRIITAAMLRAMGCDVEAVVHGEEALRSASRQAVPTADLSRGVAGVTGSSLIINLPGSPGAVRDGLAVIARLAGHVHDQLAGLDH